MGASISENDRIVVYDGIGMFASPRVWWLFRVMGARNVFVLDGGLDGWKAEARPLETEVPHYAAATFKTNYDASRVVHLEQMREIVSSGALQIADARLFQRIRVKGGDRNGNIAQAFFAPLGGDDDFLSRAFDVRCVLGHGGCDCCDS